VAEAEEAAAEEVEVVAVVEVVHNNNQISPRRDPKRKISSI